MQQTNLLNKQTFRPKNCCLAQTIVRMPTRPITIREKSCTASFKLCLKICCLRNYEFLTVYFDGRGWECFHPVPFRHLAVHVQCDFEFERICSYPREILSH